MELLRKINWSFVLLCFVVMLCSSFTNSKSILKKVKKEISKVFVIEDFDLSYNLGTAVTYLLRADRKHDSPIECIQKAINHLEFELDKLKR